MGNNTIGELIELILFIPVIFAAVRYLIINMNNPDALINYLPKFIESATFPWEIGVIKWILGLGGGVGIVLLIFFSIVYNHEI